ncbi:MAG: hypothetical protein GW780_00435 [Candidatus Aenigmarchaeota archaeon]|nr:hypothetical protein [Candidatus Aenigmarchaeota archaeon]NCS70622.1 hypothetical protein [Candidatus Aenigmarchaeota archaeon]
MARGCQLEILCKEDPYVSENYLYGVTILVDGLRGENTTFLLEGLIRSDYWSFFISS